jgi:hypothetical protein
MGKKNRLQTPSSPATLTADAELETSVEVEQETAETDVEGTAADLDVTQVDAAPAEIDVSDVTVSADVSSDPRSTVAAALVAIGKFYNEAGVISEALVQHMRTVAADPSLHSYLQRMNVVMGDARHAIVSIEDSASDDLREAIVQAVS